MNADLCAMRGNHSQTSGRAARDSVVANTAHITVTVYLIDTSVVSCCWPPARRLCSNRSISPVRWAHSSKPTVAACGGRMLWQTYGRTDGRTPNSCIDTARHTMRAVPIMHKTIVGLLTSRQLRQSTRPSMCRSEAFKTLMNMAVINADSAPRCCHLGSYFKSPKRSPVRPLACN